MSEVKVEKEEKTKIEWRSIKANILLGNLTFYSESLASTSGGAHEDLSVSLRQAIE